MTPEDEDMATFLSAVIHAATQAQSHATRLGTQDGALAAAGRVRRAADDAQSVFFVGVGKSYQLAQAVASTWRGLELQAWALHAVDVMHGDAGAVLDGDVVFALSNSGKTAETVDAARFLANSRGAHVVAVTGDADSPLALVASITIPVGVDRETVLQVPTASLVAARVVLDAVLAVVAARLRTTTEDVTAVHPGGVLGEGA